MYGAQNVMFNTPMINNSIFKFKTKIEAMKILTLADGIDEKAYEVIYKQ